MPVFNVEVTYRLPVFAADEDAAEEWVLDNEREWAGDVGDPEHISAAVAVYGEWSRCIPWGSDGDTTVDEIINREMKP